MCIRDSPWCAGSINKHGFMIAFSKVAAPWIRRKLVMRINNGGSVRVTGVELNEPENGS